MFYAAGKKLSWAVVAAVAAQLSISATAGAAEITAAMSKVGQATAPTMTVKPGSTGQIWVGSESGANVAGGVLTTNETVTVNGVPLRVGGMNVPPPLPAGAIPITAAPNIGAFGPLWTTAPQTKGAAAFTFTMKSESNGNSPLSGQTTATGEATIQPSKTAGSVDLDGLANVAPNRQAFARAKDPMLFDAGSNTFNVTLKKGGEITSTDSDSLAFFESSMTIPKDKYEFPDQPERSCGLIVDDNCVLFDFAVGAAGTLNTLFDIKPLANYADPITGIFGPSRVQDLINHFDLVGNTVTLRDDFLLANFTLTESSNYGVEFTFDNAAATVPVPKPDSYALLVVSIGLLYLVRSHPRRG